MGYSTLLIAHVGSFSEKVSMSVALSTEESAEDCDGGINHARERLGEFARGAELLPETHHHQTVDHA
jgi:hypothetical protein